jgi:hypothetical protein
MVKRVHVSAHAEQAGHGIGVRSPARQVQGPHSVFPHIGVLSCLHQQAGHAGASDTTARNMQQVRMRKRRRILPLIAKGQQEFRYVNLLNSALTQRHQCTGSGAAAPLHRNRLQQHRSRFQGAQWYEIAHIPHRYIAAGVHVAQHDLQRRIERPQLNALVSR